MVVKESELIEIKVATAAKWRQTLKDARSVKKSRETDDDTAMMYDLIVHDANTHGTLADLMGPYPARGYPDRRAELG